MTYREAFDAVMVWTLPETKQRLPTLEPSFVRDIAHMRIYQAAIYKEMRGLLDRVPPKSRGRRGPRGSMTTYAALQERIKRSA